MLKWNAMGPPSPVTSETVRDERGKANKVQTKEHNIQTTKSET